MISATIAEAHRFGRVKRNGYDPNEVDAVVARLVDTLRRNSDRIDTLTEKLDAADASADAIRKTFVAAESTSEEIIGEARETASAITQAAETEASELAARFLDVESAIAERRERALAQIYKDAENRMAEIERSTAERCIEAEWAVHDATEIRDRNVSDTEADAEAIAHKAEIDAAEIRARIAAMSQAVEKLVDSAGSLASSTLDGAKLFDLSEIDRLDRHGERADVTPAAQGKPVLTVAIPIDEEPEADDSPKTRYQRSTGIPLSQRIKNARMSG